MKLNFPPSTYKDGYRIVSAEATFDDGRRGCIEFRLPMPQNDKGFEYLYLKVMTKAHRINTFEEGFGVENEYFQSYALP